MKYNEADHPRDAEGRYADKVGGGVKPCTGAAMMPYTDGEDGRQERFRGFEEYSTMIRDASDRYLETGYADDEATREQVGRIQDAVNRLPDDHTPDDRQTEALAACVDTAIEDQMWNGGMDVWHTPLTGAQARRLIDWECFLDN